MIPGFKQFCNDFLPDPGILILAFREWANTRFAPTMARKPVDTGFRRGRSPCLPENFTFWAIMTHSWLMMTVIDLVAYLYYNPHMSAKKKKFAGGKK
jgi:hypothetical protein